MGPGLGEAQGKSVFNTGRLLKKFLPLASNRKEERTVVEKERDRAGRISETRHAEATTARKKPTHPLRKEESDGYIYVHADIMELWRSIKDVDADA